MNAPFYTHGLFGNDASLVVALLIGIGFGFFLERGGLGSATKLTAQFYMRDLTVFKMMFAAIITAMVGFFILSWVGLLDISHVYLSSTYIIPQTIGGLIFGAGFVMGGYCPRYVLHRSLHRKNRRYCQYFWNDGRRAGIRRIVFSG